MSDGNIHRTLLPSTPYASGLKAGHAIARARALEAFSQWLDSHLPTLTPAERAAHIATFQAMLSQAHT